MKSGGLDKLTGNWSVLLFQPAIEIDRQSNDDLDRSAGDAFWLAHGPDVVSSVMQRARGCHASLAIARCHALSHLGII